eukprot:TRINITY_DN20291_c0_g1_i1.p1 TRINITY_DN20291_c0_g1~~TRINITY_DN20291_c0_g1_i1.p1  ORF type:complete len:358 (-),score=75.39 TRINITY_DN20291_c0_g1_i1:913-1986(-)
MESSLYPTLSVVYSLENLFDLLAAVYIYQIESMIFSILFTICILELVAQTQGFPDNKIEQTFAGESENCYGLSANVDVQHAYAEVNGEDIVQAVAESVANALTSPDAAKAEAQAIGKKILHVTAEAVAKINAQINSPNKGCWAVAYGKAEARAIATAVVNAIAEAFSSAVSPDVASNAIASASSKSESISEAMATVALLLAKGDGTGYHSLEGTATATAKATAINCAIAHAYSEVYKNDTATAEAIVRAGCDDLESFGRGGAVTSKANLDVPCSCLTVGRLGGPGGCGVWGGADEICYVRDANRCTCAQDSVSYPGLKWRFCGGSLSTMKNLLDFEDKNNEIEQLEEGFGYCPTLRG